MIKFALFKDFYLSGMLEEDIEVENDSSLALFGSFILPMLIREGLHRENTRFLA